MTYRKASTDRINRNKSVELPELQRASEVSKADGTSFGKSRLNSVSINVPIA